MRCTDFPAISVAGRGLPGIGAAPGKQFTEPTAVKLDELLKLDGQGLVCAVIQHHETRQVLMVGYMNRESLEITLREQKACFWSRSRQQLWRKGETSGNFLHVKEIRIDCDGDALLLLCAPDGPTCHTHETSCFYRGIDENRQISLAGDGVAKA